MLDNSFGSYTVRLCTTMIELVGLWRRFANWSSGRPVLLTLCVIGACIILVLSLVSNQRLWARWFAPPVMPASALTNSVLIETAVRAQISIRGGIVPRSPTELPERKGYANNVVDAWGREVRMTVLQSGQGQYNIIVTSSGPDGVFENLDDLEFQKVVDISK